MTAHIYTLSVRVEVTDGKATRAEIEDALSTELDTDIETSEGAVLSLSVVAASYSSQAKGGWA